MEFSFSLKFTEEFILVVNKKNIEYLKNIFKKNGVKICTLAIDYLIKYYLKDYIKNLIRLEPIRFVYLDNFNSHTETKIFIATDPNYPEEVDKSYLLTSDQIDLSFSCGCKLNGKICRCEWCVCKCYHYKECYSTFIDNRKIN